MFAGVSFTNWWLSPLSGNKFLRIGMTDIVLWKLIFAISVKARKKGEALTYHLSLLVEVWLCPDGAEGRLFTDYSILPCSYWRNSKLKRRTYASLSSSMLGLLLLKDLISLIIIRKPQVCITKSRVIYLTEGWSEIWGDRYFARVFV